jgi:hypothetical protein
MRRVEPRPTDWRKFAVHTRSDAGSLRRARLRSEQALKLLGSWIATIDPDGRPHLVPITLALDDETLYSAVDRKPKRSQRLRRIENAASTTAT